MTFDEIYERAIKQQGSQSAVENRLPTSLGAGALRKLDEAQYLSAMTLCVFRAGFVWRVIENKWPGFEAAFNGFNPLVVAHYSDDKLEELARDERIVRNPQKIRATRDNAVLILDIQQEHQSFAKFIAEWPGENIVDLWLLLKSRGSRLGGNSGPMMLRTVGKDTFVLSKDVCAALENFRLIDKVSPNAKSSLKKVQEIFNRLQSESGRRLCEISRILALSIG
ncbi:MAG: DNA-3-methyladenine glycosylase I [bacterium]